MSQKRKRKNYLLFIVVSFQDWGCNIIARCRYPDISSAVSVTVTYYNVGERTTTFLHCFIPIRDESEAEVTVFIKNIISFFCKYFTTLLKKNRDLAIGKKE